MKTGLPSGLSGLLGKLGANLTKVGEAKVDAKGLAAGEGKDAKGATGPEKGAALGDGTVLAGLGFNSEDRANALKNPAEKAAIDRFMQDTGPEVRELQNALREMKDAEGSALREARDGAREARDAKTEEKTQRDELRRDEKADDVRGQAAQEAKEKKEAREANDAKEAERERERDRDDQKDDDRKGGAWAQEDEQQQDEPKKRRGAIREDDVLGAHVRCHGKLDDGARCLRKPVPGTPYCREHVIPTVPQVE
ncbi:hypothetical protein L6R52_12960 [Myxococcota bacterium]|nr:hypothetical protein [Myxococcota bacterium]